MREAMYLGSMWWSSALVIFQGEVGIDTEHISVLLIYAWATIAEIQSSKHISNDITCKLQQRSAQ